MANLKDILATLTILSAGTLTLSACEKAGAETTTPEPPPPIFSESEPAEHTGGVEAPVQDEAVEGEGSCAEGSCEGACGG